MEGLFITPEEFWTWFDRNGDSASISYDCDIPKTASDKSGNKKMRLDFDSNDTSTFRILWGRHRPGKKHKVWEEDGFLTIVGLTAHVCDEKGRLIEEPTPIDDVEYDIVKGLGEIVIGKIEIQVQEEMKNKSKPV